MEKRLKSDISFSDSSFDFRHYHAFSGVAVRKDEKFKHQIYKQINEQK